MNRMEHVDEDVVELGVASIATKGPPVPLHDTAGGIAQMTGIADD